jgi:hypothetical protein
MHKKLKEKETHKKLKEKGKNKKLKEREMNKKLMSRIALPMMRIIRKKQRINQKKIIMRLMKHQLNQYLRLIMKK